MNRRIIASISFVLVFSLILIPLPALAGGGPPDACGESARWKTDGSVLTIYGTGEVYDFGSSDEDYDYGCPWEQYTSEITSVVIDSGITALGTDMFRTCGRLKTVYIPDTITSVGLALATCPSLEDVVVSEDNKDYCSENGVLFSKDKTELILYPAGRKDVSYTVPGSVTSIGPGALRSGYLTKITLSEGLISIGAKAFSGCLSLEDIFIPSTVSDLDGAAFYGLDDLRNIDVDDRCQKYYSDDGVLIDRENRSLLCYPSARGSFSYAVPEGVTSLARNSFRNVKKLQNIYLADVEDIKTPCFAGCDDLWTIYTALTRDEWDSVWDVPSSEDPLKNNYVSIVDEIQRDDFYSSYSGVQGPMSGTCGDGITWILDSDGVLTVMGSGDIYDYDYDTVAPWYNVRGLINKAVLSEGITRLGNYAFGYCTMMTEIKLPSSLRSIGDCSMMLTGLSSVNIPASVEEIDIYALLKSHDLKSVNVDPANPYFTSKDGILFSADGTSLLLYPCSREGRSYSIPSGVTSVGEMAFFTNENLERITVPEGVTILKDNSISSCGSLRFLYLPLSLKTINDYALAFNDLLSDVYYSGVSSQWDSIAVDVSKNTPLRSAAMHFSDGELGGSSGAVNDTGEWNASYGSGTWVMDGSGTLTISGTGSMVTYVRMIAGNTYFVTSPWWTYRHDITRIVIEEGITYIATNAFSDCSNVTDVVLPTSLKGIDKDAFYGCSSLTDVWYTGTSSQWSTFVTVWTETDMYGREIDSDKYIKKAARHYEYTPQQLIRQGFGTPLLEGNSVSTFVTAAYSAKVYFITYDSVGRLLSYVPTAIGPCDRLPISFTIQDENAAAFRLLLITDEGGFPACSPAESDL